MQGGAFFKLGEKGIADFKTRHTLRHSWSYIVFALLEYLTNNESFLSSVVGLQFNFCRTDILTRNVLLNQVEFYFRSVFLNTFWREILIAEKSPIDLIYLLQTDLYREVSFLILWSNEVSGALI